MDDDLQLVRDLAEHWAEAEDGVHVFPRSLQQTFHKLPLPERCRRMGAVLRQLLSEHDERTPQ